MKRPDTISIIETDDLTRNILANWISQAPDFRFLSAYRDVRSARQQLWDEAPDLVLADIHQADVLEYVRELKLLLPGTRIILLSIYEDADQEFAALAAGAVGCLLKSTARAELLAALGLARRGVLPPGSDVARKVLLSFQIPRLKLNPAMELGGAERTVLEFLARGYRCDEIAAALGVGISTVNAHLCGVCAKLQARSRMGLGSEAAHSPEPRTAGFPSGGLLSINGLDGSRTVTIAG